MSDDLATLQISIKASMADFSAKMGEFEKILKGSEEQTKKTGAGFGEMAAGMLTAEAAMGALKKASDFAMNAIKSYDEDLVMMERLKSALGEGAIALEKFAMAREESTRFAHDDTLQAANSLQIHKLNREEIEKLLPVIQDYATKTGRDAASTAEAFGRAIEFGTTRGLRPFGIDVDKTGSQLDIFNALLRAGQGDVKGLSEKMADIGAGPMVIMQNEIKTMQEDIGKELLPVFKELMTFLRDDGMPVVKDLVDNFDKFLPLVKGIGEFFITYFAVTKLAAMATAINGVTFSVAGLNAAILANPIGAAALAATAISMGLDALVDARIAREKKLQDELNLVGIGNVSGGSGAGLREAGSSATSSGGGYLPKGFLGLNTAEVDSKIIAPIKSNLSTDDRGKDKKTGAKGKAPAGGGLNVGGFSSWAASQNVEDIKEHDKEVLAEQKKTQKAEEKAGKEHEDAMYKDAENTYKKKEKLRLDELVKNKQAMDQYLRFGQAIGQALADGIMSGSKGLGESLKQILEMTLSFIQAKIIAKQVEILADDLALYNFAGFATAAGKAAAITGAFEVAKAGIRSIKFHDGGEVPAVLQSGEYVMNRRAVAQYGVPAMEAINAGRAPAGGAVGGGSTTIINTIDPGMLDRYLASSAGQKTIVNVMKAKRYEVNRVLK